MLTVDQSSITREMADPNYKFKSNHFLFKTHSTDESTKRRFPLMLTSDPAHMVPGEKGMAVVAIQHALIKIFEMGSPGNLDTVQKFGILRVNNEIASRIYGPHTQAFITKLKESYRILNYMNKIDPIVGKKTTRALDYILWRNGE